MLALKQLERAANLAESVDLSHPPRRNRASC